LLRTDPNLTESPPEITNPAILRLRDLYGVKRLPDPGSLLIEDLHPSPADLIDDLEQVRNKYSLRIPRGSSEKILKHKHAREIFLYLELKPLFISSVIFSSSGKFPYKKIAEFTDQGISTIRKKIQILKRMKLLSFDRDKNLHLAPFSKFREIIKHEGKRTHKLLNNGDAQFYIKNLAIYENLQRQQYRVKKKILERELINIYYERKILDPLSSLKQTDLVVSGCEKYFSKNTIRKFSSMIRKNFDSYLLKYQKIYDRQIEQIEPGLPDINPYITLSCKGISKILGRKSVSTGHYQSEKLEKLGILSIDGTYITVPERSPAVWESLTGHRNDLFAYPYPTRMNRSGFERKYFRRCPNTLKPLVNAMFF
jgi:hypothetical protein